MNAPPPPRAPGPPHLAQPPLPHPLPPWLGGRSLRPSLTDALGKHKLGTVSLTIAAGCRLITYPVLRVVRYEDIPRFSPDVASNVLFFPSSLFFFIIFSLDEAFETKMKEFGCQLGRSELYDAVMRGAAERVRPIMMTVFAVIGGLLPIMWSTETGARVMKRIAAPMVGGMISSTVLTLLIIPILYEIWRKHQLRRKGQYVSE